MSNFKAAIEEAIIKTFFYIQSGKRAMNATTIIWHVMKTDVPTASQLDILEVMDKMVKDGVAEFDAGNNFRLLQPQEIATRALAKEYHASKK